MFLRFVGNCSKISEQVFFIVSRTFFKKGEAEMRSRFFHCRYIFFLDRDSSILSTINNLHTF